MSGKRILDAVALFNVSRNIAVKHFDIRLGQAKVYSQSSSVIKAIRREALPVLATSVSRFASSRSSSNQPKEGIQQDHFYKPGSENSTSQPPPTQNLDIEQAKSKRNPLPDGTIPPNDSPIGAETGDGITFSKVPAGETAQHPVDSERAQDLHFESSTKQNLPGAKLSDSLSPESARIAQRRSEDQIPAKTAEPSSSEDNGPEFGVEQEQDVFYQPADSVKPVLSALPRVRVPKNENDVQEGDSHIEPVLNADVYYHGSKRGAEEDEPSEEQLSQLFRNPKNTKMFAQKAQYAPTGVQPGHPPASSRRFHTMRTSLQRSPDADAESLQKLGADLAKDAQKVNVSTP